MKSRNLLLSAGLIASASLLILDRDDHATQASLAPPSAQEIAEDHQRLNLNPAQQGNEVTIQRIKNRRDSIGHEINTRKNLFSYHTWEADVADTSAEAPENAPPLPFTYVGKIQEDGRWTVFLSRENDMYLTRENEHLGGDYLVEKIEPPIMTLIYLPLKQAQEIAIQ